jgi:hypothetical protein
MTHQPSDVLTYGRNTQYSLLGLSEENIAAFILKYYGFQNAGGSSACERGCFGEYSVENSSLYLKNLSVCNPSRPCPDINDVLPNYNIGGLVVYEKLREKLSYTGQLVIGMPFIANHLMPEPDDFKTIYRLEFVEGHLEEVISLSELMAIIRDNRGSQMKNDTTKQQREKYNKELDKLRHEAWNLVRLDDRNLS